MLTYNSKLWAFVDQPEERKDDDGIPYTVVVPMAVPTRHSNAGLGWMLSPGRIVTGLDPESTEQGPAYEDSSGATHYFRGPLHDEALGSVSYTRDGSYLRLGTWPFDGRTTVEKGNGEIHIFGASGYLEEVRRAQAGTIGGLLLYTIAYEFEASTGLVNRWTLTDRDARTQVVNFRAISTNPQYNYKRVVDSVVLTTSTGTATYTFVYDDDAEIARDCRDDTTPPANRKSRVPLLREIKQAETGWSYKFDYNKIYGNCEPGTIKSMTLPTLGRYEWTYGQYSVPGEICASMEVGTGAPGVTEKREYLSADSTSPAATWQYANTARFVKSVACPAAPQYRPTTEVYDLATTAVIAPDYTRTTHFFTVWGHPDPSPLGFRREDHGLPFSGATALKSGDFFLSRQTSRCTGTATTCTLLRSEYVQYEGATMPENHSRVSGTRTVFADDGDSYIQTQHTDFDGYGHYRKSVTSSSFGDGTQRTSYTAYNGTAGPNGRAPGQPSLLIPPSSAWLTETFTKTAVNEVRDNVTRTAVESVCFDTNGRLVGRRTYKNAGTVSATEAVMPPAATAADVVVFREFNSVGNMNAENWYGGDNATVTISSICDKPSQTAAYRIAHTYQYGALATSKWDGVTWKAVERQNYAGSGLPLWSKDSSGVQTSFTYDEFGRTKTIASEGTDSINFDYVAAVAPTGSTSGNGAYVSISQGTGTDVYTIEHHYDGLGRPIAERRRLPGAPEQWAQRRAEYDAFGRKTKESVWTLEPIGSTAPLPVVSPLYWTTLTGYDAFGRVGTVDPPGADSTSFTYVGVRETTRTSNVATAANGSETAAVTTERVDPFGRLIEVIEPNDNSTTYDYDAADRLIKVTMAAESPAQTRSFVYDNRGFLTQEQHPEVGPSGNGWISYPCYDARGHALRRVDGVQVSVTQCAPAVAANAFDVTYTFDAAERLLTVATSGSNELLKQFTYDTPTPGVTDRSAGKLKTATRHNRIPDDVKVEETYLYGDDAGRMTRRVTKVDDAGTAHDVEFQQSYTYDARSLPSAIEYPHCTNANCGAATPRTLSFDRSRGYLTDVTGVTKPATSTSNGFSYHPTGAVSVTRHGDGSSDTMIQDSGTSRPYSIVFSGFSDVPPCPAISLTGPTPALQTIGYSGGTSISIAASGGDALTVSWYEGQSPDVTVPAGQGTTLTVGPLTQNKKYWARVTNGCGTVVNSGTAAVRVQLATPTNVAAAMVAGGGISVSWNGVSGATG
ncbi:MAG TPA: RHS repeat domain-containing protein, partial [Thermoanaerobaculia bacterium]